MEIFLKFISFTYLHLTYFFNFTFIFFNIKSVDN